MYPCLRVRPSAGMSVSVRVSRAASEGMNERVSGAASEEVSVRAGAAASEDVRERDALDRVRERRRETTTEIVADVLIHVTAVVSTVTVEFFFLFRYVIMFTVHT